MSQPTTFLAQADWLVEGSTPQYVTTLTDVDGTTPLLPAQLVTLTLTLYDLSSGANTIVNSCNQANILNTGRGTIEADGTLTIQLTALDTAILVATRAYEKRRLLIEWTWGPAGIYVGRHEVDVVIRNLTRVPYVAP